MNSEIQQVRPSGMSILEKLSSSVTDPQAAVEIARQVVELETRWEGLRQSREKFEWEKQEREAKVAFAEAFKKFKDDAPKILKSKHVFYPGRDGKKDTSYWHVELDKAAELLIPALLKVGITHRWKSSDLPGGGVRVTCYLRHELGHEEEGSTLAGPADSSGGKNPIQGIGSSTSYLERYTFLATCGLVASGADNDGAAPGMTQEQATEFLDAMKDRDTAPSVMQVWTEGIEVCKRFEPIDFRAMTILTTARDERLKELKRK